MKGVTTQMKALNECFLIVVFTSLLNRVHNFASFMFNLNRETWKWKVQATEVHVTSFLQTTWHTGFQLSRTKMEEFFYHWEKRRKHCFILAIIKKKLVVFQKVVNSYMKCSYDNTRYLEAFCPKKSYKTVWMVQVKNKARWKLYMAFCFLGDVF